MTKIKKQQYYSVSMSTFDNNSKIHIRVPDEINFPIIAKTYDIKDLDIAIEVFKVLIKLQNYAELKVRSG